MNTQLVELAKSQGVWSATANELKSTYQVVRWITFSLSIVGALLASVAGQLDKGPRLYLAIVSAVLFGVASFLTARCLGTAKAQAWVKARAASEALKRLAYTYAARGAPYNETATRNQALHTAVQEIEKQVIDLLGEQVTSKPGSTPTDDLTTAEYVSKRARAQVSYYESNANKFKVIVGRLRKAEFLLAFTTAIITAVAGVLSKDVPRGTAFDFVALTAVLTTVSGAILAHIEASRYDFLVTTYRATARRLSDELTADPSKLDQMSAEWPKFVEACETAIATENGSWVLKMSKNS